MEFNFDGEWLVLDLETTIQWIEGRIDNSPKNHITQLQQQWN